MQRFAHLFLAATLLLCGPALAQDVKFEKYTLDNGMTVILHEDHALPVVTINTWYAVGSKDEPAGRSGFAHLFEHLMFMGTQRVPNGQFDILMENGGGSNNASTAFDRTNYFSNGPASLLPTLLWLDADRLEDLGRTMTQEKLDLQRDVVRNERRQSIENAPYGKADLIITAIMFPEGHPYHNEVIGTHADLEAAQVVDVKDFFANFYVPNNASLVVAGDFNSKDIKPLIAGLFGTIARGADPIHITAPPVKLGRVITTTTLDQVQLPKLSIVYHSPPIFAEGDAEMDLVAAVLTRGKSSRLYKRLILDNKLAADVSAYQGSNKVQSTFRIDVTMPPNGDIEAVQKAVDEEVMRLIREGVTKPELDRQVATIEMAKLAQLQSVQAKADKLNEYEFYFGDPNGFKRDLDRYRNATPAAVQNWAKNVLTPDSRLIVRILSDQPSRGTTPRDTRPQDAAMPSFAPAKPEEFTLSNGMKVLFWPRRELPLVSAQVLFVPGGPLDDAAHPGRSSMTADMLEEGAGDLNAVEFGDVMQSLGAAFYSGASRESASVGVTVLQRNFDKACGLMADAIIRPHFEQSDFDRVERLRLDSIREMYDSPQAVAAIVGARVLYGKKSPFAWPTIGTQESIKALTLNEVKAQHKAVYHPAVATVLLAGDLSAADAKSILEKHLGAWKSGGKPRQAFASAVPKGFDSMKVVLIDRPGAVQTVVRYVAPGETFDSSNRVQLRLLNELFGGGFTSRINQNLRETNGYTYGARSQFSMEPSTGSLTVGASVRADVTGPAIQEFINEFKRIRAGDISVEEAAKAAESQRTEAIQGFSGLNGLLGSAAELVAAGMPLDTIAKDMQKMRTIDAAQLNRLAMPAMAIDRGVLVLVGDRSTVLEQIKGLGLPEPVEYDTNGEPKASE